MIADATINNGTRPIVDFPFYSGKVGMQHDGEKFAYLSRKGRMPEVPVTGTIDGVLYTATGAIQSDITPGMIVVSVSPLTPPE